MDEKSKKVKTSDGNSKSEKLSYEQLEQVAGNLNKQCQQLFQQLKEAQRVISEFNEIGLLLDILDKSEHFGEAFVERCSKKIEEVVTTAFDNSEKQEQQNESTEN